MPKTIFFLCIVCLLSSSYAQEIIVDPPSWDFGKLLDTADIVKKTFIIKNNSQSTITLFPLPSSCGCTMTMPVPDVLEPGQISELQTMFVPKGLRGLMRWEIKLMLSPAVKKQEEIIITLQADIQLDALLSESMVNFKVFKKETFPTMTIWMANYKKQDFKLLSAKTNVEAFDVSFREEAEVTGFYPGPQRGYRIDIACKKNIPYGRNDGKIYLETDITGSEKIELPLFAYASGEITVVPDYVSFGILKPGVQKHKKVTLTRDQLAKFRILQAKSDLEFVGAQIETVVEDIYYFATVTVQCTENTPEGEFRGKIILTTDCEKHPEVEIKVQGIVKK